MRAMISKLIAMLASLTSKGIAKMTGTLDSVETVAGNALSEALTIEHEAVAKVESLVGLGAATADKSVDASTQSASATVEAAAVSAIDAVISTVKALILVDGTEPKAWAALVDLAKKKAATTDVDAVLAKLKLMLPLSGTTLVAWDETVAAAKAIAA